MTNKLNVLTGKSPSIIINNIHRKYLDLNRIPEHAYNSKRTKIIYNKFHKVIDNEIRRKLLNNSKILFIDIHGFSSDSTEIVFSTRNNKTIINDTDINILFNKDDGIYNILKDDGFNILINDPFYGGFTIKNVSVNFPDNVSSIQIEIGNRIRFDEKTKDVFIESLAIGIKNYINKGKG